MSFPGCLPRASLSPPFTLLFSTVAINRPGPKLGCTCTCAHDISSQRFLGKSTAILRGRFKGADVFPKRPRPAAILPREKIHSPSLSLFLPRNAQNTFSPDIKTHSRESKYQSKYPKAGKHLYPFVLYTTDLSWNNT